MTDNCEKSNEDLGIRERSDEEIKEELEEDFELFKEALKTVKSLRQAGDGEGVPWSEIRHKYIDEDTADEFLVGSGECEAGERDRGRPVSDRDSGRGDGRAGTPAASETLEPAAWICEIKLLNDDLEEEYQEVASVDRIEPGGRFDKRNIEPLVRPSSIVNMIKAVSDNPHRSNADVIEYIINDLQEVDNNLS